MISGRWAGQRENTRFTFCGQILFPLCSRERSSISTRCPGIVIPSPGCVENKSSGRSVGTHLFFSVPHRHRASVWPLFTPEDIWTNSLNPPHCGGRYADAQGTGRSKSQTNKTSVYSSSAMMDCLLVQNKSIPFLTKQVKTITPSPPSLSPTTTLAYCTFFFFPHFPSVFLWSWSWGEEPEIEVKLIQYLGAKINFWGCIFLFKQNSAIRLTNLSILGMNSWEKESDWQSLGLHRIVYDPSIGSFGCVHKPCYMLPWAPTSFLLPL